MSNDKKLVTRLSGENSIPSPNEENNKEGFFTPIPLRVVQNTPDWQLTAELIGLFDEDVWVEGEHPFIDLLTEYVEQEGVIEALIERVGMLKQEIKVLREIVNE